MHPVLTGPNVRDRKRGARRLRRRKRMKREHQINFWYVVIAVLAILTIQDLLLQASQIQEIPYSEFQSLASENKLADLVVGPTRITGAYKEPVEGKPKRFATVRVDPAIAEMLRKGDARFAG